jgi:hypothetical protein
VLTGATVRSLGVVHGGLAAVSAQLVACVNVIGPIDIEGAPSIETEPQKGSQESPLSPPCGDAGAPCVWPSCKPMQHRCEGAALQRCNSSGTTWELFDQCASEALCAADRGACITAACSRGEHRCTETGQLIRCSAELTQFEPVEACRSQAFCSAVSGREGCEPTACLAGRQRCNGPQIEECRADRRGFDVVGAPCASAALCIEAEAEPARCAQPVCEAGAFQCVGAALERCAGERDRFMPITTCAAPELCNQTLGQCDPPPVPPPVVVGTDPYTFIQVSGPGALGLGPMELELPAEWTDVDTRPWTTAAGQTLGPLYVASTSAARFAESFDIPGVYFGATALVPIDVAAMQTRFDMSLRCSTKAPIEPYRDQLYVGTTQTWTGCGVTNATIVVVAAIPDDKDYVAVVIVTILGDQDRVAMERIWRSFIAE